MPTPSPCPQGAGHGDGCIRDEFPVGRIELCFLFGIPQPCGRSDIFNPLGSLNSGSVTSFTINANAPATGTYTNAVSVGRIRRIFSPRTMPRWSPPSVFTVPVAFLSVITHTNGSFTMSVRGQPGQSYIVQASTDLMNWTPVFTNTPVSGSFQISTQRILLPAALFPRDAWAIAVP